jgi:phenylacetate-coenzyme A ligase PaaK-like adenylate-forming protein
MSYEETRQRHLADWAAIMPEHVQRLGWPASRLRAEREQKLRALLRIAIERSPWHRRRLAGLDPDTATEASLGRIPPMTTGDLMAHWDEIVTEPRLRLDLVEKHLAGLTGDAYLLGEFHAVASGGSSGQRGVFVYGWDAWATAHAGFLRPLVRETMTAPDMAGAPGRAAVIAAQHPAHMSAALAETFAGSAAEVRSFPVALPVAEIVAGLNQWQPAMLLGYPTALALLAAEARAGRLRIVPRRVIASSEPLLPETRQALEQAFGAPVANMYGTSEAGPMAVGCWRGTGMHLCDDLVIVEPADQDGRPVPPGTASARVYVTAPANPVLPLIRFELTDQVTVTGTACPCGSAHTLIADVQGRLEDAFRYPGGATIHPHVFGSALRRDAGIVTYQVRQTPAGAEVLAVGAPGDPAGLESALVSELRRHGLADPAVTVRTVDEPGRLASGKTRRFIPLAPEV